MDLKRLCLSLVECNKEEDVIKILKNVGFWDDNSVWRCFGDIENNYATIGNQQSTPEAALVEKVINSVDAVLMNECLKRHVKPDSNNSPQSICQALENYFDIYEGKLSNISAAQRAQLANNISLVATGSKSKPCYSIIDKGEGQTPEKLPETILSIKESNKLRIPFVQGRFNMGGTGVFRFCGMHNLQLILSKRNPEIAMFETDINKDNWSFTIIKREDPSGLMKNSIYKYLAPNNKLLHFNSDGLNLLPGDYPIARNNMLYWGTFIKLYEYQITGRFKTNILFDLYNRLAALMPNIALPVRLFERRKGYVGHSMETTLSGLSVRLSEDRSENLEANFPTSASLNIQNQKMYASIFAFKKGQSKKYMDDEGILFTINGQTHGYLPKSFFNRKSVGMGYISDSILVLVDCSEFEGRAREDLFMNSRDRLVSGELRSNIEDSLENLIKNHQGLKQLLEKRRREDIQERISNLKPLAEVLEKIIKVSPTLSRLFIKGERITNPFKTKQSLKNDEFIGREFPTYFTLIEQYQKNNPKLTPKNVRCRIRFKTDAENNYFSRDNNPGEFKLEINSQEPVEQVLNLWNGIATLNISLPNICKIGEVYNVITELNDVSKVEPIKNDFYIKITEPVDKKVGKKGNRTPPSTDKNGDDSIDPSKLNIPNVIEVRRDDWIKHSFNEYSAVKILYSEKHGIDIYINMDNSYLIHEQKYVTDIEPDLLGARYKFGIVLISLSLLNEMEEKEDVYTGNKYEEIEQICKALSPILLPMISSLGTLNVEEVQVS